MDGVGVARRDIQVSVRTGKDATRERQTAAAGRDERVDELVGRGPFRRHRVGDGYADHARQKLPRLEDFGCTAKRLAGPAAKSVTPLWRDCAWCSEQTADVPR